MTVSSTTARVTAAGNGVTTAFAFAYLFQANADLIVCLRDDVTFVETLQTITTHYTVSGAGSASGGTVTFVTAPATGKKVIIYRDPAKTQDLSMNDGTAAPLKQLENRLDKLTLIAQRAGDLASRAVGLTDGQTVAFNPKIPVALPGTASVVMATDPTGLFWEVGPTTVAIAGAAAAAAAAAASAAAAATAKTNAETAETNAETAETNAETAETNAAASAVAAAAATASKLFSSVNAVAVDTVLTTANNGQLITVDATGAGRTITLPSIAALSGVHQFAITKLDVGANTVTIARNGTDTIGGVAANRTLTMAAAGIILVANAAASPDDWGVVELAPVAAIADGAVTLAKLANLATKRAIGRNTAGTGVPEAVTAEQIVNWIGTPAQGDVLYQGASDIARLPPGTADQVLVTGGAAANPSYKAATALVPAPDLGTINGFMSVWQRNTTFTPAAATDVKTADRWLVNIGTGGAATVSRQTHVLGAPLGAGFGEPAYFLRWAQGTGGTGTLRIAQRIEGVRKYAGQNATAILVAKVSSGTLSVTPKIVQCFGTGGSPSADVTTAGSAKTITATFTRFSETFAVPSISGKTLGSTVDTDYLELRLEVPASTTFTLDIGMLVLVPGSAVIDVPQPSFEATLRACQRFHSKSFPYAVAEAQNAGVAGAFSGTAANAVAGGLYTSCPFPVPMRAAPSMTLYSPSAATTNWSGTSAVASEAQNVGPDRFTPTNSAGATDGGNYLIHWSADAEL